ncbi:MAG: site-2 protease family protein [Oscillospiraceae bacterium]|nr:site-2 protease family protein [Oscillospiraceae bacterium]
MGLFNENFTFLKLISRVFASLVIIFFVTPLHEYAHAFAAYKLGDKTAFSQGRLSPNPLKHIDIFGAISLLFFGYGWAKAVPVNTTNFKNKKTGLAITSAAGPIANFLMALIGAIFLRIMLLFYSTNSSFYDFVVLLFFEYIYLNISSAIFNLIPIPPLDGFGVMQCFFSEAATNIIYRYQEFIKMALIVAVFTGILRVPMMKTVSALLHGIFHLVGVGTKFGIYI